MKHLIINEAEQRVSGVGMTSYATVSSKQTAISLLLIVRSENKFTDYRFKIVYLIDEGIVAVPIGIFFANS